MNPEEIPSDVRDFLRACIPSVGHMEALLLIVEEPHQVWRVDNLARRLYVSEAAVRTFLGNLSAAGLLVRSGSPEQWVFAPKDEPLAGQAARALRMYRERLLPMTKFIQSREDAGTQLADAFRFRKS